MPTLSKNILESRGLIRKAVMGINDVIMDLDDKKYYPVADINLYSTLCHAREAMVARSADLFAEECLKIEKRTGKKPFAEVRTKAQFLEVESDILNGNMSREGSHV